MYKAVKYLKFPPDIDDYMLSLIYRLNFIISLEKSLMRKFQKRPIGLHIKNYKYCNTEIQLKCDKTIETENIRDNFTMCTQLNVI